MLKKAIFLALAASISVAAAAPGGYLMAREEELPPELGNLTQLEALSVHKNRLRALPPSLGRQARIRAFSAPSSGTCACATCWRLRDAVSS